MADAIWFPSRVYNGSFERWQQYKPSGWMKAGSICSTRTGSFLGEHAVELSNGQPWESSLYQNIAYESGTLLFGCAHHSENDIYSGNRIDLVYLDAAEQEIGRRSWESAGLDWEIILTPISPPGGTETIRIELIPQVEGIDYLTVDHVFLIPVTPPSR